MGVGTPEACSVIRNSFRIAQQNPGGLRALSSRNGSGVPTRRERPPSPAARLSRRSPAREGRTPQGLASKPLGGRCRCSVHIPGNPSDSPVSLDSRLASVAPSLKTQHDARYRTTERLPRPGAHPRSWPCPRPASSAQTARTNRTAACRCERYFPVHLAPPGPAPRGWTRRHFCPALLPARTQLPPAKEPDSCHTKSAQSPPGALPGTASYA